MTNNDLVIKITAETDKATKEIKKLTKEIGKLSKTSKKDFKTTSKDVDKLTVGTKKLGISMGSLVTGAALLGVAMKTIEFADMAASAEQGADAFKRVFEDMGLIADEEFAKIKEASKGLIPDSSIKQSAVTAVALGVPIEKLTELMEIARVKAREMGTDAEKAFNDLAIGIGRGSPLILDNLGFIIKIEEANKKWAASNNETVESMTKQQKQLALTDAVIEAGAASIERYADVGLTAKEHSQQFNSELKKLKENIGSAVLPALDLLTVAATELMKSFNSDEATEGLDKLKASVDNVANSFGEQKDEMSKELKESIDFTIGVVMDGRNLIELKDTITGELSSIVVYPNVKPKTENMITIIDEAGKQIDINPSVKPDTKNMMEIIDKEASKPSQVITFKTKIDKKDLIENIKLAAKSGEDDAEITVVAKPDFREVEEARAEVGETIEPIVLFDPDRSIVDPAIYDVSKTITVPVYFSPMNSIPSGAGFASGGFTGSGSDSEVAGVVHKNEFVVPANAVREIGVGNLMNMIGGLKGYQDGGLVGSTEMTPINLSVGGNSFGMMADSDVAMAIQRYVNSQGGL